MRRKTFNKGIIWPRHRFAGLIAWSCVCLSIVIPTNPVSAQQRLATKNNEAELRRKAAIELIVDTAEAARTFKDLFYRARLQTRSADLLWPYDEVRARTIFRRAWEAATAYDKAEQEAEDRESGVPSTLPITEARDEVLTKAAARDSKLGEEFLDGLLDEEKNEENSQQTQQNQRRTPWRQVSLAGQYRLALAYELLKQNQPNRAADIASKVINEGASGELMAFITRLREVDNNVGDAFYQRLVERSKLNGDEDTNTVLLLSSQIVSPWLLSVVDERGSLQFRQLDSTLTGLWGGLPSISPAVRLDFYFFAASILLRTRVPRSDHQMLPDAVAMYVAIGRLLPYFEREAPQHVANLRERMSTLINDIESGRREALDAQIEMYTLTPERPGDILRPQLDQLGRARDALDRDRIALGIVKKAAQKRLWDRARRGAMEIVDVDIRRSAMSYIAVCQIADLLRAFADDKELNTDRLAKFVRNADVPPLVTAWGMAQTAIMAKRKGDVDGAAALLDEAVTFAARTPAGTWQRVAAYAAIARLATSVDVKRAWDLLPEVVRAANALEGFGGDEESIDVEVGKNIPGNEFEPLSLVDDVFQIDGLFSTMAQLEYEKALTAARSLGKETPRAFALLAIARIMLEKGHRTQDTELRIKN